MLDLNKYLQDQLALAKQKNEAKNHNHKSITQLSVAAADAISKKQQQCLDKSDKAKSDSVCKNNPSTSAVDNSTDDNDSNYLPSCDEEDIDIIPRVTVKNTKQTLKTKIIDDGDSKCYKMRIAKWQYNLKTACSGENVEPITSADIKHIILSRKTDIDEMHELQNGLKIPTFIWKQLYKYQKIGVKWLWELHQVKAGGLLGDEMGLGKTVQIIAFFAGLSKSDFGSWSGLGPSIIVAPATVIYQWVSHFHYWSPHLRVAVLHNSGSHVGSYDKLIRDINMAHGVLLVTYAGIVKYMKALISWKWHYCILDEGHKIRNPETQVSKLLRKFPTSHRLIITGSPLQNNLMELWTLYDFIRPGLLGTQNAFMEYFAIPITQGGYANATEYQEVAALEIAKALKDLITPYILRRTKVEVQDNLKLPDKNEQVLFCALSSEQRDLYMGYLMSGTVRSILDKESRYRDPLRARILVALSTLRKLCNHPDLYLYEAQEMTEQIDEEQFGHWRRSGKMSVVNSLLKIWQKQGHRALIFTQSRAMICIIEQYLQRSNFQYIKMDGTVSVSQRQSLIKIFNENSEYLVFLATTRVGGIGVNLTGADRVIIYDPDWNPATDTQAKERAWRIGQLRSVSVYRLLSAGTIEEKIYQRQVFKHLLSNKVLLDPNQKNILTTSSLQGLFTLEEPNSDGDTETSSLFKHTKVILNDNKSSNNKKDNDTNIHLSGSVSFSKTKLEAMRKMAKEISKKITAQTNATKIDSIEKDPREKNKEETELRITSQTNSIKMVTAEEDPRDTYKKKTELKITSQTNAIEIVTAEEGLRDVYEKKTELKITAQSNSIKIVTAEQDPREKYKKKREREEKSLNPPKIEEPELNLLNGKVTDTSFETILSEIEIVNLHVKKNYEENLIKEFLDKQTELEPGEIEDDDDETNIETMNAVQLEVVVKNDNNTKLQKKLKKVSKKRKHSDKNVIDLVSVKKNKNKHSNKKHTEVSDDNYVLSKLFAKSTVKNALHHDEVVGLVEKEKMHKLKEVAARKARDAIRAIKSSVK